MLIRALDRHHILLTSAFSHQNKPAKIIQIIKPRIVKAILSDVHEVSLTTLVPESYGIK